jgi:hypothetical protein
VGLRQAHSHKFDVGTGREVVDKHTRSKTAGDQGRVREIGAPVSLLGLLLGLIQAQMRNSGKNRHRWQTRKGHRIALTRLDRRTLFFTRTRLRGWRSQDRRGSNPLFRKPYEINYLEAFAAR